MIEYRPGARYSVTSDDRYYYIRDDYSRTLLTQDGNVITHTREEAEADTARLNRDWVAQECILDVRLDRDGDRWYCWAQDDHWYQGPLDAAHQSRQADLHREPYSGQVPCLSTRDLERRYGPTAAELPAESLELAMLGAVHQAALGVSRSTSADLRTAVIREDARGRGERDITRQAGVDRMTVRTWLGKR